VGSSNDLLKELAQHGASEGTVVIGEEQVSARGRLGRSWHSPKGGAWFSILLRPQMELGQSGCIAVTLAVGLAHGLREAYKLPIGVKWPNDLWLNGRKLGGILIELASRGEKIEWLIAGIGINVNNPLPSETRVPATSLAIALGREIALEEFYRLALGSISESYENFLKEGFAPVRARWREVSVLGDRVGVHQGEAKFEASVVGLSESGKLLVRTMQGIRELAAEEVSLSI
ncbi:biotin--[acetyl-CoA-carboxylase] ligase, partial [Candidatus Acetothermia bacterium]|nr:biotin--[acetyl-CoA-carboxylase] ligase [Candidatus Acetothermia bacterium]